MITINFCDRDLKFKSLWEAKKHVLRFGGNCFYVGRFVYFFDGVEWNIKEKGNV